MFVRLRDVLVVCCVLFWVIITQVQKDEQQKDIFLNGAIDVFIRSEWAGVCWTDLMLFNFRSLAQ